MEKMLTAKYENPKSPAFGKNSQTIKKAVVRKYPHFKGYLTDKFTQNVLERLSMTYSTMRKLKRNKYFHSMSLYSTHPHYRWHVVLQDMTIF